jgi:transposase
MKRGQQKTIPAFSGKRQYLHVIGAYSWRTDQVETLMVERKNSDSFIEFLEQLLLTTYKDKPVVLVMDNAAYHHSAHGQAFLSLLEHRVHVIWLPPYCSELNMIERFWKHLTSWVCVNRLYQGPEQLQCTIKRASQEQNDPLSCDRMRFHKFF